MAGFSQGASGIADRIHWFNFTAETSISAMHTMYLGLPRVWLVPGPHYCPRLMSFVGSRGLSEFHREALIFVFVSWFNFSLILPAVRISFLFYSLVFIGDSTDPGLLKIRLTSLVCCCGFCLYKCFCREGLERHLTGTGKNLGEGEVFKNTDRSAI